MASGFFNQVFILVGEEQNRLFRMINYFGGEIRLIGEYQRHIVFARDIFSSDDCEFRPRDIAFEENAFNPSARDWTPHSRAVEHSGK